MLLWSIVDLFSKRAETSCSFSHSAPYLNHLFASLMQFIVVLFQNIILIATLSHSLSFPSSSFDVHSRRSGHVNCRFYWIESCFPNECFRFRYVIAFFHCRSLMNKQYLFDWSAVAQIFVKAEHAYWYSISHPHKSTYCGLNSLCHHRLYRSVW